jgi:hypothetical protein
MMSKIAGVILIILGIYFLIQNIMLAKNITDNTAYIAAVASTFTIMLAITCLLFFTNQVGSFGLTLLTTGAIMVFLSDGFLLQPSTMYNFFVAFVAFVTGFQLIRPSKIQFR